MHVRRATIADLGEITRIYNHAVEHTTATFDLETFSVEARRGWFERFDDRHPCLVAEVDDTLAGFAYLLPYRPKPAYARTAEMTVYVDEAFRRRGIARALYEALIDHGRAVGLHALLAVVADANPASVALHASLGFREVGRLEEVGRKFDRWIDTRFYELLLP